MPEKNEKPGAVRIFFKVLGVIGVVLLFAAVVGFGLLVGACGTLRH